VIPCDLLANLKPSFLLRFRETYSSLMEFNQYIFSMNIHGYSRYQAICIAITTTSGTAIVTAIVITIYLGQCSRRLGHIETGIVPGMSTFIAISGD